MTFDISAKYQQQRTYNTCYMLFHASITVAAYYIVP